MVQNNFEFWNLWLTGQNSQKKERLAIKDLTFIFFSEKKKNWQTGQCDGLVIGANEP